jgi:GNAT superfamily N-acetyltransferase
VKTIHFYIFYSGSSRQIFCWYMVLLQTLLQGLCIEVSRVDDESSFWKLYDTFIEHDSQLKHWRTSMLDAFRCGNLYSQRVIIGIEDGNVGNKIQEAAIWATGWLYTLPMFCVIIPNDTYELLWVHPELRLMGFGRRFVEHFSVQEPERVAQLPEAFLFWDKCFFFI